MHTDILSTVLLFENILSNQFEMIFLFFCFFLGMFFFRVFAFTSYDCLSFIDSFIHIYFFSSVICISASSMRYSFTVFFFLYLLLLLLLFAFACNFLFNCLFRILSFLLFIQTIFLLTETKSQLPKGKRTIIDCIYTIEVM